MNIAKTLTPAALVVALILTALPAAAQNRPRSDGRAARESAPAATRDAGPRQSAPRAVAPRQDARAVAPRQDSRAAAPRQDSRAAAPRQDSRAAAPRDYGRAQAVPRSSAPAPYYRNESRHDVGRAYGPSRGYVAPHGYHSYATPYYHYYGTPYRPYYFGHPYYSFRPRFSIGFGLWLGFGVPYPYSWVSYPPPVYGYYQGAVRVVPGATAYGGVSFDISPRDAAIILDGTFIGYASDFAPNAAPLTLAPGPHRIEVQADGYQPMSWDVDIVRGQVIPFRGDMQPY
jgi:hypothetical protein